MEYIEVTVEDALKIFKGDPSKTVLIAVKDLEDEYDTIQRFSKVKALNCKNIIKSSETLCHSRDELLSHLLLFSHKQNIQEIKAIGSMTRIIY